MEICTNKNKNLLIQFDLEKERNIIFDIITENTNSECETNFNIQKFTKLWVSGLISNYEYLIALNSVANRTRNDLSQYPVFPWVIANYESSFLDLSDQKNFRDLSKPIGALNQKRLDSFRERYKLMPDPKFLYGTHYSNPAYVISYLVRKYPHYMLKLQCGRFDHPDRLFNSIETDWYICMTNPASLKELTPEFYENNTDFLLNLEDLELGVNSKNEKINVRNNIKFQVIFSTFFI